jgi:hypothetical protein|tara:strand:- start:6705 stop:6899 length:195 start_codon:yes stop_codon:yes gene_type:complete
MSDEDNIRLQLVGKLKEKLNTKDNLISQKHKNELSELMKSLTLSETKGYIDGINFALSLFINKK